MTDAASFSIKKSDGCPQGDHGNRVIKKGWVYIYSSIISYSVQSIRTYRTCTASIINCCFFFSPPFSKRLMIYSFDSELEESYFDGSKLGSAGNCWVRVRLIWALHGWINKFFFFFRACDIHGGDFTGTLTNTKFCHVQLSCWCQTCYFVVGKSASFQSQNASLFALQSRRHSSPKEDNKLRNRREIWKKKKKMRKLGNTLNYLRWCKTWVVIILIFPFRFTLLFTYFFFFCQRGTSSNFIGYIFVMKFREKSFGFDVVGVLSGPSSWGRLSYGGNWLRGRLSTAEPGHFQLALIMQKRLMCARVVTTQRRRANAQNKMHKRERDGKEPWNGLRTLLRFSEYLIRYKAHRTTLLFFRAPEEKRFPPLLHLLPYRYK